MNDSRETSARETSAPESEGDVDGQIRELRLQLERLEASRQMPQSANLDLAEEPSGADEESDRPDNPATNQQPLRRWSPIRVLLMALVAAVLCIGGFQFWNYLESYENTDDAQVNGYLDPISSRINGTISAVHVDDNQEVKAGQLLIQLDPSDYQVAVEQARAQLAQAQADLNSASQQYVSAVATVRQADAQNYLAQRNAHRFEELVRLNVVSQSEWDQVDATARAQDATVKAR